MDIRLTQHQTQKQILAPQLRQFIQLLELPVMELKQKIEQELAENPVLEEVNAKQDLSTEDMSENTQEAQDTSRADEWVQNTESFETDFQRISKQDLSRNIPKDLQKKRDFQESILTKPTSLSDFLTQQLGVLDLTPEEEKIAQEIIGDIDEDGWFQATTEDVAKTTQTDTQKVETVLKKIQQLDPPGVGGRSLQEVLLIQLARVHSPHSGLAKKMVELHMTLVEKKHFAEIAKALNTTPLKIQTAYELIKKLEPKPGSAFLKDISNYIQPDAVVYPNPDNDSEFIIEIPDESIPELRISSMYRTMLKDKQTDAQTKQFIKQRIQSGMDLIRAIAQRKSTIRQITEELVNAQKDFFIHGFSHLKPLRLKDISEKLKIHESTVSRAIQGKYILTPQGTIPYKNFFSAKLGTENGSAESQKSVMERIKFLTNQEDKRKPLSDAKIVQLLKNDGIVISRRTIAKYRDRLKILPTHLRKQ